MTKQKLLALFIPAAIVIALDQWTKHLIRSNPDLHRLDIIDGWLAFYYTQNSGMAMGIDILSTPVISAISIIATVGIVGYLIYSLKDASVPYLILMGLVVGGALGNISDRLFMGIVDGYGGVLEGHVTDFIHFNLEIKDWPVFPYIFNVADMAISVSIVSLILFSKKLIPQDKSDDDNDNVVVVDENPGQSFTEASEQKENDSEGMTSSSRGHRES